MYHSLRVRAIFFLPWMKFVRTALHTHVGRCKISLFLAEMRNAQWAVGHVGMSQRAFDVVNHLKITIFMFTSNFASVDALRHCFPYSPSHFPPTGAGSAA